MRLGKKGTFTYEFVILLFASGLMLYLLFSSQTIQEKLGWRQFQSLRAVGKAELNLFEVDQKAKHTVYDALKDLASSGGYSGEGVCGSETRGGKQYMYWSRDGKPLEECFPSIMKEFKKSVRANFRRRSLNSDNYDLYVDDKQVVGIAFLNDKHDEEITVGGKRLGSIQYFTKPSFRVMHNYPFDDYELVKGAGMKIVSECAVIEDESGVRDCIQKQLNTLPSNRFESSYNQEPGKRVFTFDITQKKYQNVFTGPVKIKFALGLELRIHPEAFTNTKAAVWDGTEEKSFDKAAQTNQRLPEKITVEIPLAKYKGRRTEISFDFDPGEAITSKEIVLIQEGERRFTDLSGSPPERLKFLESTGGNPVRYYVQDGMKQVFYVPIPKEEASMTISARYTAGEEYRNLVEVSFKGLVETPEEKPSTFFEGQIIPLDTGFENFVLIGDPDTEFPIIFLKEKNLWIPNTDFTIEEGKLLLNGEEVGFPLKADYVVETTYGEWNYSVYYTLAGDAEPSPSIYLIERTDRISGFLEVYTSIEFFDKDLDTWKILKEDAEFDYLTR